MGLETDAKFEALLSVYEGPVFVIDDECRYRQVVEGVAEESLLYEDPDELLGQRFADLLPPDTAERFADAVQRSLATGEPTVIEYDLDVVAGHRWFQASIAPISTGHGEPEVVIWAARDVTDRKEFEHALTELHEAGTRLTSSDTVQAACEEAIHAVETILDFDQSIGALEDDGVLQAVATSEALPEDTVSEIPIDEGVAGLTYRTGESRLTEDIDEVDVDPPQDEYRSGISIPIGDHGTFQAVSREPDDFDERDLELAELLLGQLDATLTRIENERELERRNERLDEFASIVSHDLQNPLNVATGNLALAREDHDDEHLEKVATAHDRMQGLIEDLLALAQTGADDRDREAVDVPTVVEECWTLVENRGATLEVETDRTIRARRNRLQQLLENLLANAVQHGSTDPPVPSAREGSVDNDDTLTVTVGDVEDGLYVADDGTGIPEDERDRLFEFGVSNTDGGTGFGLHIVETIAESHGWEVDCCESADGGTRFEITGVERPERTAAGVFLRASHGDGPRRAPSCQYRYTASIHSTHITAPSWELGSTTAAS
jgi:PAS domain S-box-containing protein